MVTKSPPRRTSQRAQLQARIAELERLVSCLEADLTQQRNNTRTLLAELETETERSRQLRHNQTTLIAALCRVSRTEYDNIKSSLYRNVGLDNRLMVDGGRRPHRLSPREIESDAE